MTTPSSTELDQPPGYTALWTITLTWTEPACDGRRETFTRSRYYETSELAHAKVDELEQLLAEGWEGPAPGARDITIALDAPPTRERFIVPTRAERDHARQQIALIRDEALRGGS